MGAEETNPPAVPIDEGAEERKEPEQPIDESAEGKEASEKPVDESAEGGKEPEESIDESAEGRETSEKPVEESAEGGKEAEQPIESRKGGWLGKLLLFKRRGWLEKALSFKKGRWSGKVLMFLGGGGVILFLVGIVFIFNLFGTADTRENVKKIVPKFLESHFPLSSFLVRVSSANQDERFVWIRIVLKVSKGDVEAIRSDLTGFRFTVFKVILHKRVEELMSHSGKNMLKREIQWKLNKRLEGIEVQGIYFVDFLIL